MRRSNPFEEIERMFERMSRQFDDMSRGFDRGTMGEMMGGMMGGTSIDVSEYDGEIVVVADLPGFDREDIDLTISENMLTIEADRKTDAEERDGEYLRRERRHESVRRAVKLPETVDDEGAHATYKNGVLTVTLPKVHAEERDEGHHIDVE